MKTLFLALSGGVGGHDANEAAQRETWAGHLPSTAEIFWLKGDSGVSNAQINKSLKTITVPVVESYENLLPKTILAISKALEELEFDFLIRTNTSSFFSIELVEKQLTKLDQHGVYAGVLGEYFEKPTRFVKKDNPINYISGAGIWMSKDVASELATIDAADYHGLVDDVAIGNFLTGKFKRQAVPRQNVTDFEPLKPAAHTRVKHWSKDSQTVRRMWDLEQIYESKSAAELEKKLKEFDRTETSLISENFKFNLRKILILRNRIDNTFAERLELFTDLLFG